MGWGSGFDQRAFNDFILHPEVKCAFFGNVAKEIQNIISSNTTEFIIGELSIIEPNIIIEFYDKMYRTNDIFVEEIGSSFSLLEIP